MPDERENPAALGSQEDPDDTTSVAGGEATPAASIDVEKELRDLKAQQGRELAQERQRASTAERQVVTLNQQMGQMQQQLQQMGQALTRDQQQRQQAYLQSLPPEQRQVAEVQILRQRVDAMQSRPPQQPAPLPAEELAAYQRQKSAEILGRLNAEQPAGAQLKGDEDELDWSSEQAFLASAKALAKVRARYPTPEGDNVARKNGGAEPTDMKTMKQQVKSELLQELGFGGSNAPKAAGGKAGALDVEKEVTKTLSGYSSKAGSAGQIAKLKEIRDQARTAVGR